MFQHTNSQLVEEKGNSVHNHYYVSLFDPREKKSVVHFKVNMWLVLRAQPFKVYFHLDGQFFDLNGRMGYVVNENQFMESKLNYVLAQMLEKHNPDFDITVRWTSSKVVI